MAEEALPMAEGALPVRPARSLWLHRLLYSFVPAAGSAGAVGGAIGGAYGGIAGAALGMTIGVMGSIGLYAAIRAYKDHKEHTEHLVELHKQFPNDPEGLHAAVKAERGKHRLQRVLGTGIVAGAMGITGIGVPAMTALPALAVGAAALGAAYLATRAFLAGKNRLTDPKHLRNAEAGGVPDADPEEVQDNSDQPPVNQPFAARFSDREVIPPPSAHTQPSPQYPSLPAGKQRPVSAAHGRG